MGTVIAAKAEPVRVYGRAVGDARVWVNEDIAGSLGNEFEEVGPARLREGRNRIVVKLLAKGDEHAFFAIKFAPSAE